MRALAKPRVVIFDLDETLMVEYASVDEAFLAACALARTWYGIDPEALHLTIRREARALWHASPARDYCLSVGVSSWEGLCSEFPGQAEPLRVLREWAPHYRQQAWRRALAAHGVQDGGLADRLADTFCAERKTRHVLYPEAQQVLKALRGRYPLALLTNGLADLQRQKLAATGLGAYFQRIVISGELGFGKPDPRLFLLTLAPLGVDPEQAVMVGNSLHADIAGAQSAGLLAVWVNRNREPREEGIMPDAEIRNLRGLLSLL